MYCSKCGTKADKKSEFCAECGASLTNAVATKVENKSNFPSFLWGILGFFVPLAGLILFIVWNKDRKTDAQNAGIGALIRVIVNIVLIIIWIIICFNIGFREGLEMLDF